MHYTRPMRIKVAVGAMLLCLSLAAPHAPAQVQTIRAYKAGSSSFPDELMQATRMLLQDTGQYDLQWDSASYTRLDQFISKPYLYDEWCGEHIPQIQAGNYDYVIFQTIGWFNFTPEEQDRLLTEVLPDLTSQIQATGAEIVLYDKYVDLLRDESDPQARAWAGRYPEGVRMNNLLHVMAGKHSNLDKVTFGGGAVHELWDDPYFEGLDWIYNDGGHPGPMANYISACALSSALAGIDPVGSSMKTVPLTSWQAGAFEDLQYGDAHDLQLYNANKDRISNGQLFLTDQEAATLQQTAMAHHNQWTATLQANLADDAAFAATVAEVDSIRAQQENYEAYNLSQGAIDRLTAKYEEVEEGQLTDLQIQKAWRNRRRLAAHVGNRASDYLTPDQKDQLEADYFDYWTQHNSQFRDHVYFENLCYQMIVERGTDAEEVSRVTDGNGVHQAMMSLIGMKFLLQRITPEQQQAIFDMYAWTGARKRHCPKFTPIHNEALAAGDLAELFHIWDVYLSVWDDPDLMDLLLENHSHKDVWLEADQRFFDIYEPLPEPTTLGLLGLCALALLKRSRR